MRPYTSTRWTGIAGHVGVLFALANSVSALAQQRYPIQSHSDWQASSKYTQQHIIDVGDVPGHQIRILEIHRTYNEKSQMAVSGVKVKESWTRGYSDYIRGIGRAWGYSIWVLEDGNKVYSEYSGTSRTVPTPRGAVEGTYFGTSRLTGGTGKFKGVRGLISDRVEFNSDPASGYNKAESEGEYWFED